jgi:hypothetical protein
MPDPLRSPWTRLSFAAIFLAPLVVGFCLESRWLTQAGFVVLFAFMLGAIGYECLRWQRRRHVRENVEWILRERDEQGFDH